MRVIGALMTRFSGVISVGAPNTVGGMRIDVAGGRGDAFVVPAVVAAVDADCGSIVWTSAEGVATIVPAVARIRVVIGACAVPSVATPATGRRANVFPAVPSAKLLSGAIVQVAVAVTEVVDGAVIITDV